MTGKEGKRVLGERIDDAKVGGLEKTNAEGETDVQGPSKNSFLEKPEVSRNFPGVKP